MSAAPSGSPAASGSPAPQPTPEPDPTPRLGFTTTILGRQHVPANQPVTYPFCPPTSGDHYAQPVAPIPARFYAANEEKSPALWIHNLEHGYVVLAYRCPTGTPGTGDCPTDAEMAQMQAFFDQAPNSAVAACPKKVLVVRFDEMSTRFGMLAWGRALLTDQFDLDTALTFAEQWMDHEVVPERGSC